MYEAKDARTRERLDSNNKLQPQQQQHNNKATAIHYTYRDMNISNSKQQAALTRSFISYYTKCETANVSLSSLYIESPQWNTQNPSTHTRNKKREKYGPRRYQCRALATISIIR